MSDSFMNHDYMLRKLKSISYFRLEAISMSVVLLDYGNYHSSLLSRTSVSFEMD